MCSRHQPENGADSGPVGVPEVPSSPDYQQAYEDALAIESEDPGTVCLIARHYVQDHRHPIPYRQGYVHHYREANEHWHVSERQLRKCNE